MSKQPKLSRKVDNFKLLAHNGQQVRRQRHAEQAHANQRVEQALVLAHWGGEGRTAIVDGEGVYLLSGF